MTKRRTRQAAETDFAEKSSAKSTSASRLRARTRPLAMPLRTWLVVIVVAVSGLGLALSAVAVSSLMRDVIYTSVDEDLRQASSGWALIPDISGGSAKNRPPSDFYVYTVDTNSGRSGLLRPQESEPDFKRLLIGDKPRTIRSTSESKVDYQWRAMATERDGVLTVVAKNVENERGILRGLALIQVFILTVVLLIIALAGFFFIRHALRPLRVVEKTATQIARGDLDRRVPEWPLHTEVGQLAASLNVMLGRLQQSILEAQDKEEQMRRFVGDASHELRTPLTSLRGYTELYRSGATDDVDRVFSKIDDESKRMSLLVEDLLSLTRAEGNRLDKRTVDMLELTLSVASSARAAFPDREIAVENRAESVPVVNGDPDRLHQVLLNLVTNGLRHGGSEAAVTLVLRQEDGHVLIDVADDGKGMTPEVASHIFERFYREDSSRTRDTGGSGLGLAIVKSLVSQHGGTITVESEPGEGSVFTVSLPVS